MDWYTGKSLIILRTNVDASLKYLIPIRSPAAPGSQYGASKPENAVTKYTPPVSSSFAAKSLTSAAELIIPMVSRSHFIALPATATRKIKINKISNRTSISLLTATFQRIHRLRTWSRLIGNLIRDSAHTHILQPDLVTYRAQEPVVALHDLITSTEQQKSASAICTLGFTLIQTLVANQRCLLITHKSANGDTR